MMKPNDKAIEAARKVVIQRATHNFFNPSFLFGVIEAALDAAYAAQFQSEDYDALLKSLHANAAISQTESENQLDEHGVNSTLYIAAADALEAVLVAREAWKGRQEATAAILKQVETERDALKDELAEAKDLSWFWEIVDAAGLNNVASCEKDALRELVKYAAERDALKGIVQRYQKLNKVQLNIRGDLKSERDALAARLAPVEDEALVEIAAHFEAKFDGWPFNVLERLTQDLYRLRARDFLAAIRPHIEAAERERCAKAGKAALLKSNYGELHADANYADELGEEIAAAIRSGK